MYKYDYIRASSISIKISLGNVYENVKEILNVLNQETSSIAVFQELTLTGYGCLDFFKDINLLKEVREGLKEILIKNQYNGYVFLGLPLEENNRIYNTCVLIKNNEILQFSIKHNLSELEKRVFSNENIDTITFNSKTYPVSNYFSLITKEKEITAKIEIGEDNEINNETTNLIINLGSDKRLLNNKIKTIISYKTRNNDVCYIYTGGNITDSTTLFLQNPYQTLISPTIKKEQTCLKRKTNILTSDLDLGFKNKKSIFTNLKYELEENINYHFLEKPTKTPFDVTGKEEIIIENLIESIIHRLEIVKSKTVTLGLSGGLDSSFALLILLLAYKKYQIPIENINTITLPSFSTSKRTKENTLKLKQKLNLNLKEINISKMTEEMMNLLEHDKKDTTYENIQARIRTSIIMNLANKVGGIAIGTADMSEIALGFSTYNADNMGMYNLNANLPKTTIQQIFIYLTNNYFNNVKDILLDILNTPISAELSDNTKTEEIIGLYEINDFIMYYALNNNSKERIIFLLEEVFNLSKEDSLNYYTNFYKRFYNNQYKRQILADSVLIFETSISQRLNTVTPSDYKRHA